MLYVIELINGLQKYQSTIFTSLHSYLKSPAIPEVTPLDQKLAWVGDFPAETLLSQLLDSTKPLSIVIGIWDTGEIISGAEYGRQGSLRRTTIALNVWTADPVLREQLSSELYDFLTKNPHLIQGTQTPWQVDMIQSNGYRAAPEGLYRRAFMVWLKEFHTF